MDFLDPRVANVALKVAPTRRVFVKGYAQRMGNCDGSKTLRMVTFLAYERIGGARTRSSDLEICCGCTRGTNLICCDNVLRSRHASGRALINSTDTKRRRPASSEVRH